MDVVYFGCSKTILPFSTAEATPGLPIYLAGRVDFQTNEDLNDIPTVISMNVFSTHDPP